MAAGSTDILFISHGGGPMPLLGDPSHTEMVEHLKMIAKKIKKPSAIIILSAHWEAKQVTITSAKEPSLYYDYNGFPKESYSIKYPAPSQTQLSNNIHAALTAHDIKAEFDDKRGFDHGMFVPLTIMYPEADIPCVQVSLLNSLDPAEHIKLGEALGDLEDENLLILGSGFTFHNMQAFFAPKTADSVKKNESFESWLIDTCTSTGLSEEQRTNKLTNWENAPGARYCHPREEHLLPLHVCYGAAKAACKTHYELSVLNKKTSMFLW